MSNSHGIILLFDDEHGDKDVDEIIDLTKQKISPKWSRKKVLIKAKRKNPNEDSDCAKKRKTVHEDCIRPRVQDEERCACPLPENNDTGKQRVRGDDVTSKNERSQKKYDSREKRLIEYKEKKKRKAQKAKTLKSMEREKEHCDAKVETNVDHQEKTINTECSRVSNIDSMLNKEIDESIYVALDCEFVGTGLKGCKSALGRCTIVDFNGNVICDVYSKPEEWITDYRTRWSGLRPNYLRKAIPFENARYMIKKIIREKILIGHAVYNDLGVLGLHHPPSMIRDTATYTPLHSLAVKGDECPPKSLKKLSRAILGRTIQKKTHCSEEDALATLDLFKLVRHQWEAEIANTSKSDLSRKRTVSENSLDNSFLNDRFWPGDL